MVSKIYNHDIDLNGNSLLNAIIQVLASAPGNAATAGRFWFNSTDHKLHFGDGTSDVAISAGTTYTDEMAQDAVAAALTNGSNITVTYNDAANTITIAVSGTLTHTFISDFDTQVRTSRLDQMAVPTSAVNFNSQKATSMADGTVATDGATWGQVLAALQGRNEKTAVRLAATANVPLTTGLVAGQTIDGSVLVAGDRVLLPLQTTASQNGIYVAVASGTGARATDMDVSAEVKDAYLWVGEGAANADTFWKVMNDGTITLDTTSLVITKVAEGSTISAGTGLTKTGTVVAIDTAVVARKYSTTFGDGSATSYTITHNLGTRAVEVAVFLTASTYDEVDFVVQHATTNTVTILCNTAPASGAYTAVVVG